MDQGSGAGSSSPAAITTFVKSVITNQSKELQNQASLRRPRDHRVADLFGRCFLRVCYWVDVFSSMARRGEPRALVSFPQQQVASLAIPERAKELIETDATTTAQETPIASA